MDRPARAFLMSFAPESGTASRTGWLGVIECTVLIPAVIMRRVRSLSRRGRIMCARAVVVHDPPETTVCRPGSNLWWLMP